MLNKYNIVYIHSHDSGNVFSPYGYDVPTPKIEAFSKDATLFENAYCVSPTCSPSRSGLLTGKFPHSNGMLGLANRGFTLNNYQEHLVNILNDEGYTTALCGIQHEYGRYVNHAEGANAIGYKFDISAENIWNEEKDYIYWDDANTKQAKQWLSSYDSNEPFFLSIGYFATHREYPEDLCEKDKDYKLPDFLEYSKEVQHDYNAHVASLKVLDRNVGEVIESLKQNGLYENTIIILTTDHGIAFPKCKCTLFEAGTKISLMLRLPDIGHGLRVRSLMSHVDVVPTILGYCGCNQKLQFEGLNKLHVLTEEDSNLHVFSEINCHTSYEPCRSIRGNRYKYIKYYDEEYPYMNISNIDNSISKDVYVEKSDKHKEMEMFYDLENDPLEKNNLINDENYKDIIDELKKQLIDWQEKTNDYLLNGPLTLKKPWKVNTSNCTNPKSKKECDFLEI